MSGHLVLSGGPQHDFAASTAVLVEIAAGLGLDSTVVTEPGRFFAALADAEAGANPRWSMVTVNALRWRMSADRYAVDREQFAFTLDPIDAARLERHVVEGGGLLALHTAAICFDADPAWHRLLRGTWRWDQSTHPPLGDLRVERTDAGLQHAIGSGESAFVIRDELYCDLDVDADVVPLFEGVVGGTRQPVVWAHEVGAGRVVTDLLGHDAASLRHPQHAHLIAAALTWARRRASINQEHVDV